MQLRALTAALLCLVFALPAAGDPLTVEWFYTEGCHMCAEVKQLMGELEAQYAQTIAVQRRELKNLDNYKRMMRLEKLHGIEKAAPMEVFVGGRYLLGHKEILAGLPALVADAIARGVDGSVTNAPAVLVDEPGDDDSGVGELFAHMRPLAVAGGGFIDGINPCAFATVVFLISVLSSRQFERRRLLAAGLMFAAGVFVAYFLVGLGAMAGLMKLRAYRFVSDALFWGILGAAVVLAVLSLHDAWRFKTTGSTRGVVLKLSDGSQRRIHGVVRRIAGARSLLAACLFAGFAVSVLEVVCTGQIYLPTIMVMVQEKSARASGLGYLLLYNVTFLVPLLAVLLLYVYGVRGERFMQFSRQSFLGAKLLLALFFLLLGALLLLGRF